MQQASTLRIQHPRRQLKRCLTRAACAAAAVLSLAQAHADWQVDTTDPSKVELVFLAWDNNGSSPKLAFVKDLGMTMTDFFTKAQDDGGAQFYWYLGGTGANADDANWTSFLTTDVTAGVKADVTKVKWAVFAMAQPGGNTSLPGAYQLYTTNQQGASGSATKILGFFDLKSDTLSNTSTAISAMYGQSSSSGTLASATNGSALIKATDGNKFPFDSSSVGVGNNVTFGGNFSRDTGNLIGKSSWFYYLTGSDELDSSKPVLIDEFDNLGNDGYWGLAKAAEATKAGEYFLSYTIGKFVTPAEATNNIMAGNNFARLAGNLSLSSAAGKGGSVLNLTESFLRGYAASVKAASAGDLAGPVYALSAAGLNDQIDAGLTVSAVSAVSAVPESGTAALFGLGLLALAARTVARRRDGRAAQAL